MNAVFASESPEEQAETARAFGEYMVDFLQLDRMLHFVIIHRASEPDLSWYGDNKRPTTGHRRALIQGRVVPARLTELRSKGLHRKASALEEAWERLNASCDRLISLRNDVVHYGGWDDDGQRIDLRHAGEYLSLGADEFEAMSKDAVALADQINAFWQRYIIWRESEGAQ